MKALIDPRSNRVCQLEENEFPVALPLFWVVAPENVTTEHLYINDEFVLPEQEE